MKGLEVDVIIKELIYYLGYDFRTKSRKRHFVYGRALFYKICKDLTLISLSEIGEHAKGKPDHCVVLNGLKTFEEIKMYEPKYMKIYETVKYNLENRGSIVVSDVDLLNQGLIFS